MQRLEHNVPRGPGQAVPALDLAAHRAEPLSRSADFDDGLVAYAKLRPTSPLPSLLVTV